MVPNGPGSFGNVTGPFGDPTVLVCFGLSLSVGGAFNNMSKMDVALWCLKCTDWMDGWGIEHL